MFELTLSVKAFAIFCAQLIAWGGISTLLAFFVYFKDDPGPYSIWHHVTYGTLVSITFAFIFGIVTINWVS